MPACDADAVVGFTPTGRETAARPAPQLTGVTHGTTMQPNATQRGRPPTDRRRGRARPGSRWLGAVVLLAAVGIGTAVGTQASAEDDLYTRGGEVFQDNCAACHGTRAEGGTGSGDLGGPAIDETDINYWDLTVRTGRMPIVAPEVGIRTDVLDEQDREALAVYASERFDLPGAIPTIGEGDASRGQDAYVRNCAACHGAAADGGISGAATQVPALVGLDGVAIYQATRIGPFEMPGFDPAVLSDDDIDDLVAYLDLVDDTPRSPAGVREVDQISSALFAVGLALLAGVVVLVVARVRRWSPHEPEGAHADPPFEPRR